MKRESGPASFVRSSCSTNGTDLQLNVLDSTRPVAARFFDWCETFLPSLVPGVIKYAAAGLDFRISGGSFFQVNRFLIDALVNEVLAMPRVITRPTCMRASDYFRWPFLSGSSAWRRSSGAALRFET